MRFSLWTVYSLRGALHRVGDAIELGGMAPVPQGVEPMSTSLCIVGAAVPRHHRKGASRARESGRFGKAAELYGHFARAVDFKYRMGQMRITDEGRSALLDYSDNMKRVLAGLEK